MRVVAGIAGGRHLRGPANGAVRPTTDKVRGAIFNSLESLGVVEEAVALDLFAGTGALGIEALSRGAKSATFVDKDRKALQVVSENLRSTGLEGAIVQSEALTFLQRGEAFDLAFVDPPYVFQDWTKILALLNASIAVCESSKAGISAPVPEGWESVRERRYGDTMVTILRRIS